MKFEELAREAGRALSASGKGTVVPPVADVWARRRRRGLVLGSASLAIVAIVVAAAVANFGGIATDDRITGSAPEPGVSVPSATVPLQDGGFLFSPPRIERGDSVEFPITLLDGTELSLTLPQSLAGDIAGLVPGGAASWTQDPCCGRSLEVMYGSVAEVYGERQPDVEYEDADGNPVGFYTEEDDVDYLAFQFGSWVVRAWDGDAEGQRFSEENREMFAALMRGAETADGFLVLDPLDPMSIRPTDSPDATLTDVDGNGVIGAFKWRDCASEGPFADPDMVTSSGHLVSFAESSGMTSICFPESSLHLWLSRVNLTQAELESIDLVYSPEQPDEVPPTSTTTTPPAISTTTPEQTTTSAIQATEHWSVVPDHPVVGRVFPVVVWTGNEIVVWGGEKPSEGAWHADGAAFNPTTGAWRDLAESPLSSRSEHVAVWTGDEIIICCGRIQGVGASAAAYDPLTDEWREIESPPINPSFGEAVWTGDEMLVFGGVGGGGTSNLVGAAAYDPTTDSWRRLADLPYGLERTADATVGDGVVYAWPSSLQASPPNPLAYDIASDEWRLLPDPPVPSPSSPSIVWTGDALFAFGAGPRSRDTVGGIAVVHDPTEQTWRSIEPPPLDPVDPSEGTDGSQQAIWVDGEVYIWTGWVGTNWDEPVTRVLAYDPTGDSWRELEPAPIPGQGLWHEPIIWTGTQLITYSDPMLLYTP